MANKKPIDPVLDEQEGWQTLQKITEENIKVLEQDIEMMNKMFSNVPEVSEYASAQYEAILDAAKQIAINCYIESIGYKGFNKNINNAYPFHPLIYSLPALGASEPVHTPNEVK